MKIYDNIGWKWLPFVMFSQVPNFRSQVLNTDINGFVTVTHSGDDASDYNIVGVLWGVDTQSEGVHENIVWVAPIQNLNIDLAIKPLCNALGGAPRACK